MQKNISSIEDLSDLIDQLLQKWYKKFLLSWDLWVWKTEFTKQLAKKIWIENISSPTYIEEKQDFLNLWILEDIEDFEYICIERPKFKEFYKDKDFLELDIKKNWENRVIIIYM